MDRHYSDHSTDAGRIVHGILRQRHPDAVNDSVKEVKARARVTVQIYICFCY